MTAPSTVFEAGSTAGAVGVTTTFDSALAFGVALGVFAAGADASRVGLGFEVLVGTDELVGAENEWLVIGVCSPML